MADYIEREAAKNALRKIHQPNTTRIVLSVVAIDDIPAADVRPVEHGEWEHIGDLEWDVFICNKCKMANTDDSNFCPNCGADMRGAV